MSNNNSNTQINTLLSQIQENIDNGSYDNVETQFSSLKQLLKSYESSISENAGDLQDNNINYTLRNQSLTLEQRENLLNTKLKQIEIANERNTNKKNMLTLFIIINIIIVMVFIGLIVYKVHS